MIKQFTFNHYEVNCYIIYDGDACAIVDPGAAASYEDAQIAQFIEEQHLKPTLVLLTHAHVDHIAGLRQVCERYGLPVTLHADGQILLKQATAYADIMGFDIQPMGGLATRCVGDGDLIDLHSGAILPQTTALDQSGVIECRHVPGHCPGSLCYVIHGEQTVLTGDALFHLSIGRTDLPGGDYPTLIEKLKTRVLSLPDDYKVLPGHAIPSNIGKERLHNPFLSN